MLNRVFYLQEKTNKQKTGKISMDDFGGMLQK